MALTTRGKRVGSYRPPMPHFWIKTEGREFHVMAPSGAHWAGPYGTRVEAAAEAQRLTREYQ